MRDMRACHDMTQLNRHMAVHDGVVHTCPQCPSKYRHEGNLQTHLRVVHGVRSRRASLKVLSLDSSPTKPPTPSTHATLSSPPTPTSDYDPAQDSSAPSSESE